MGDPAVFHNALNVDLGNRQSCVCGHLPSWTEFERIYNHVTKIQIEKQPCSLDKMAFFWVIAK